MTTNTLRPGPPIAPPPAAAERRDWLMLAVLVVGQFMALLDVTIVNVAMPTIHDRLHASGSALQLVVSGYSVTYAMLLITSARLGDLRGHRTVFLAGLGTFTLASLACGLAPSAGALIGARFVQGAGAALMVPQILSVIQRRFSGADRTRALGVYAATLAVGGVTGQLLGGVLVSANLLGASWRPVFLVNVPVGLALAVLVPRLVPADHVPAGRRLDLRGLVAASTAVLLIVLPLVLGHEQGWPAWTWASLGAGVAVAWAFLRIERSVAARGGDPLLNLAVFRAPGMTPGLLALAAAMVSYGAFLFTIGLHLQLGLGDSALRAGLTFTPAAVAFGAIGYWWRRLPERIHDALPPAGLLIAATAYLALAVELRPGTRGGLALPALLALYGLGMGAGFSPLIAQALTRVPPAEAADASGLVTTTLQLSQGVGVAVFGSLFLDQAARPVAGASAVAISNVDAVLAALSLLGVVGAMSLTRTVRAAALAARPSSSAAGTLEDRTQRAGGLEGGS
jgi:EmrB/QacA subfamily drug resistance transporter